jgi:GNAT superfamily N-acetyltransferase
MDLSIRPAKAEDLPCLLALYRLLDVGRGEPMRLEDAQEHFVALMNDPRHTIYVAHLDDRVVGTFALIFIGGLPHGARDSCIVEDVVVSQELQGQGVGRFMMRFAMNECAQRSCYKMVLSSHLVRAEAHRFYEGLGFRRHGYSFLIDDGGLTQEGSSPAA